MTARLNFNVIRDVIRIATLRVLAFVVFIGILSAGLTRELAYQTLSAEPSESPNALSWNAVDDFGRLVSDPADARPLRPEKKVGLFYFLWFEDSTSIPVDKNRPADSPAPYNITAIQRRDPNPTQKDDLLADNGQMHYWGEPLFGYYDARDPYVIRRHMQLIADAGVDVLLFDVTNVATYPDVYLPLCDVLLDLRAQGFSAPQISFITNTNIPTTVKNLWREFYSQERYKSLFFEWKGKPLLVANPSEVPEEYRDFFTLRAAYWPTRGPHNSHNEWRWVDAYPQPYSWDESPDKAEEIVVSTAQNVSRDQGAHDVWMSERIGRGRSFVYGAEKQRFAPDEGLNFAQQWTRVDDLDPEFVLVTGWNEWIAGRWRIDWAGNRWTFVDQFNQEYSRDVEPARGLHLDAYYLQTIAGIRRFKGAARETRKAPRLTVAEANDFAAWSKVEPTLRDYRGDASKREFDGKGGTRYVNASGRNDLTVAKVARADDRVYFYLESAAPIEASGLAGLRLALDLDDDLSTGWRGADLLIGDVYRSDGTVVAREYDPSAAEAAKAEIRELVKSAGLDETVEVERLVEAQTQPFATSEQNAALAALDAREAEKAGARAKVEALKEVARTWRSTSERDGARWRLEDGKLLISVPTSFFADPTVHAVSFKWLDNLPATPSVADFYDQGDVAPEGAFFYRLLAD